MYDVCNTAYKKYWRDLCLADDGGFFKRVAKVDAGWVVSMELTTRQ